VISSQTAAPIPAVPASELVLVNGDQRFTVDGSPELENELRTLCAQALAGVRGCVSENTLEAMLLGGGYGRGEGGVLRPPAGSLISTHDQPYNDLEFYIFLRGPLLLNERKYQPLLHLCGEEMSQRAGIEVEFHVISFAKLRQSPPSMFYYDLVMGHRWVFGEERLLDGCEHHRQGESIPLSEATRLLMNRCSGLLFAKERLAREKFTSEDADFVGRNLAKAQLALGDVALTVQRKYHWSCRERNNRLGNMRLDVRWIEEVNSLHREGVAFKLHPHRDSRTRNELMAAHNELSALARKVWLWLENKRLNCEFTDPRQYSLSGIDKCPETSPLKNLAINLKSNAFRVARPFRYPRDRILNSLPLLLWVWDETPDPSVLRALQHYLATNGDSFASLLTAYQNLWRRFN
jgi:hypothetical protein